MRFATLVLLGLLVGLPVQADELVCEDREPGVKQLYWGDLHVHTGYSLDATSFGTIKTPADAFRFARGEPLEMPGGGVAKLDRPLDFMATTDHAEWFGFLNTCTGAEGEANAECRMLADNQGPENGGRAFAGLVVPSITLERPQEIGLCKDDPARCAAVSQTLWERIQAEANAADDPCHFSAIIGFEWSATPNASHTHRNIIFRDANVSAEAIDYVRYPAVSDLFDQLDRQCRAADGCQALAIPHNTNLGDGESFDVETESDAMLRARERYERLIEIFQEKGNSECLAPFGAVDESDCNMELRLSKHTQLATPADFTKDEWERMRGSYVRGLLLRGLAAWARSGADGQARLNPLALGIVGATDNHTATPGLVSEADWVGTVFGIGSLERRMSRLDWNPGGLTAVWAEQNTRADLFDAMSRREVYGTSGTRIRLRFDLALGAAAGTCSAADDAPGGLLPMGGEFSRSPEAAPRFRVHAQFDAVPLERIEIIKGAWVNGEFEQAVIGVWSGSAKDQCVSWADPAFDPAVPAFWYARVQEAPSRRWSSYMCREAGRCEEFPGADAEVRERAWSSPIWYLPEADL